MTNVNYNQYDIFIFDCDGVILDSNDFKNQIFLESVKHYSLKNISKFEKFIKVNKGLSRYYFYEYFFSEIAKLENKKKLTEYKKALNFYNKKIKSDYKKCKYIPGVIKFIKKLTKKNIFVISGSNQKELIKVFKEKNIYNCFNKIYGSPKSKIDNAIELNLQIKSKKILYFGDSYYDYKVSKKIKSDFIFISGYSDDTKLIKNIKIKKIKDFTNIYI
jgi:HAD superfamily hydrolase (TIGR01549 family)